MAETTQIEVRTLKTRAEIETLRDFWAKCSPVRDADFEFFLFISDLFPETLRPHVIVIYKGGVPESLIAGRLEASTIRIRAGYFRLPAPNMRIVRFVHGGWLGELRDDTAKLLVNAVIDALASGEADAAEFQFPDLCSPLVHWAVDLPSVLCVDRSIRPQTRRVRDLSEMAGSLQMNLSQNERYQQRKRTRRIEEDFSNSEILHFRSINTVERLMRDAETIAKTSYQRGIGAGFFNTPILRERLEFEAKMGWLRASILYLDKRPTAFWIGSLRNRVFLSDYLAFDPSYSKYSPGLYLIVVIMEELCKEMVNGQRIVDRIDFGIGDATYKERLSNNHWDEALVYIFAPNVKGIYTSMLRTAVGLAGRFVTAAIGNSHFLRQLKRNWRRRAAKSK